MDSNNVFANASLGDKRLAGLCLKALKIIGDGSDESVVIEELTSLGATMFEINMIILACSWPNDLLEVVLPTLNIDGWKDAWGGAFNYTTHEKWYAWFIEASNNLVIEKQG